MRSGPADINIFREKLKLYNEIKEINFKECTLIKKYWRQFIDKMKFPVFIDHLNGFKEDEIFWYQKNKVYRKIELLEKYLEHTKTGNNNDSTPITDNKF